MKDKEDYIQTQIGNPEGVDIPNKKHTIQEYGLEKEKSLLKYD